MVSWITLAGEIVWVSGFAVELAFQLFSTLAVATIKLATTECAVANHYQTKTKIVTHPPKTLQAPIWKTPKCPAFAMSSPWTLPPAWRSRPEAHPPNPSQWFLPRTILSAKRSCWGLCVSVLSGLWWQVRTTTRRRLRRIPSRLVFGFLQKIHGACLYLLLLGEFPSNCTQNTIFVEKLRCKNWYRVLLGSPILVNGGSFSKTAALHPKLFGSRRIPSRDPLSVFQRLDYYLSFAWIQKACDTDLWTVRQERRQPTATAQLTKKPRPTWLIPDEASRHHFLGAATTYRCPTTAEVWRFIENNSWSFLP